MSSKATFLMYGSPNAAELRERAARFGFTDLKSLEHLHWDYEFIAQLQALDSNLILRGGAAAQLYLKLELQRGSNDVDFITSKPLESVRNVVNSLAEKFKTIEIRVEEYIPRHPVPGLNQLTYFVHFPKLERHRDKGRIKLEIQESPFELPSNVVKEKETLPLVVRNVRCLTRGALIGDKLTTLALNTIGVGLDDLPKQLYDVSNLIVSNSFSIKDLKDLLQGFETIAQQQCRMKKIQYNPAAILDDILRGLAEFARWETPGERLNQESRRCIRAFASQYLSRSGATDDSGWETKSNLTTQLVNEIKKWFDYNVSYNQLKQLINSLIPAR